MGHVTEVVGRAGAASGADDLPPGQHEAEGWPVMHYGRVPTFRPDTWDFQVIGATAGGLSARLPYDDLMLLPQVSVVADFHCVTKYSIRHNTWAGVAVRTVLQAVPPAPEVTHVLVWADRGYTANLRLADLTAEHSLLAHSHDGRPLSPEHGWPLRLVVPHLYGWKGPKWVRGFEYLTADRRGFWEERGYHNIGEVWGEQRYSYQELPQDGPSRRGQPEST